MTKVFALVLRINFFSIVHLFVGHYKFYKNGRIGVLSLKVSSIKVSKKAKIRNRYNQVPPLTQDTTWETDKSTRKRHIQESQDVSPFLTGDHKATMNRQESIMTNTKYK